MTDAFLIRAEQLARARELVHEDASYASATALLSVHAAIAFSDALLDQLIGRKAKATDHRSAVGALEKACRARKLDSRGIKHLRNLLSEKSTVSYSDETVTFEKAFRLAAASQSFERWAYSAMEELQ